MREIIDPSPPAIVRQLKSLITLAGEINRRERQVVRVLAEHAREQGEALLESKARIGHGAWLEWVEENLMIKKRQVQRYIRVAQNWEEIRENLTADATLTTALRLLAERESEPEEEVKSVTDDAFDLPGAAIPAVASVEPNGQTGTPDASSGDAKSVSRDAFGPDAEGQSADIEPAEAVPQAPTAAPAPPAPTRRPAGSAPPSTRNGSVVVPPTFPSPAPAEAPPAPATPTPRVTRPWHERAIDGLHTLTKALSEAGRYERYRQWLETINRDVQRETERG